jgi:hypothetical protein
MLGINKRVRFLERVTSQNSVRARRNRRFCRQDTNLGTAQAKRFTDPMRAENSIRSRR